MAFVTKSVFGQLAVKLDLRNDNNVIDKDFFINNVYYNEEIYPILYKPDIKRLYNYKLLLENSNNAIEYFIYNEKKEDDLTRVNNKGGYLKFHLYKNCEALNKDYLDFIVPQEVIERGFDLVNTYRGWFKTMKFYEQFSNKQINDKEIVELYNNVFAKTHNLKELNIDYKISEFMYHSGNQFVQESFNLKNFESKLDEIIGYRMSITAGKTNKFLAKLNYMYDRPTSEVIKKFQELSLEFPEIFAPNFLTNYGYKNLSEFWKIHNELKLHVINLLESYFRWTFHFDDINFEERHLEDFGLRCCTFCKRKSLDIQ